MFNQGSGMGGGQAQDFEQLSRQYWAAWGEALRGAAPGSGQAGVHAWQDALGWWTRSAQGGRNGINEALERFNTQARDWYAHMQQVAAQFAGREHTAADIAQAWKQALGAAGTNPFPEMLRSMRGKGLAGLEQWVEDASPWLDAVRGEGMAWLRLPTFGAGREHQERLQRLAQAALEYEHAKGGYDALMLKASQRAFAIFEDRLAAHAEPGRQIETPRALFDLWVDAAEEAYAEIALSPGFRQAYAELVNAQMRLRAAMQQQVEQLCSTLGMPTRTEVDAAHRKIVDLERALRQLRDAVDGGRSPAAATGTDTDGGRGAGSRPAKAGSGAAAGRKKPAKPAKTAKTSKTAKTAKTSKTARTATAKRGRTAATTRPADASGKSRSRPAKAAAKSPAAKRAVRKLAPRPSVTARRPPARAFSSHLPIPDAPRPPDAAPVAKRGAR